ncbi:YaiI/YqxD family protein [Marinilactibacillus kalidii]|uniref:YaiI/YqxD family protein n=1 Tax=Marinilactibacillus kalidii TaxID=2820274 RepID=UPI001ABEA02B|nr:YaiI/YqxD family protein [Marinilactibacillus kalidii]
MKVFIDADACPVKDVVIEETTQTQLPVVLVSSIAHFSLQEHPEHVETVYVEKGADSADFKIVQLAKPSDIIITQDYGLASLLLPKGCIVLHHKGFQYTTENIDQLLQTRHLSAMARKSGQRTKGPKAFNAEDREKFRQLFRSVLDVQ